MAINYTQAFNAGELSRNIDGRSDFEVYKVGCRSLENFVVLQQGGVERRAGTEFVQLTGSDGSAPARLIPFDFSSDTKYVIELGTDYAKVHYTDANGADQVVTVTETDNIGYTTAELETVQFNRRYDTLVLTCPTKETMILERTAIDPTFAIRNIFLTLILHFKSKT
jgi:WD40 repeat protein